MVDRKKPASNEEISKESDRQFLERTNVGSLMKDVLGKIIANRPEDPIAFLADYFDSIEDSTSLVQKAEQALKMTHYSRPLFETNVRMAYDILCKHKVSKRVSGVNGTVYTDLLTVLCRGMPEAVINKLLQRIECGEHEAIHFDVFKSGVFTCCVLQDFVKVADLLYQSLDVQKTGKANKALCDVVIDQLHTALGSNRNDARRILESGYNLGVDGLYLALERAMSRSHRNASLQTGDQFIVEICEAFISKGCKKPDCVGIASDGNIDGMDTDTQDTSFDGDSPQSESVDNIRSSRQMPVPEYLERRAQSSLVQADRPKDLRREESLPPSYEEAVRNNGSPGRDNEPEFSERDIMNPTPEPHGASGGPADEGLSPTEIALIMKMREGRDSYLPEQRNSQEEAVEMLSSIPIASFGEDGSDIDTMYPAPQPYSNGERLSRRASTIEDGIEHEPRKGNRLAAFLNRQPPQRMILIGVLVFGLICLILFLGLFPASFVYLEYHQIALKQSKLSGVVNREEVFYPGCYILGPDTQFVRFQGSVHNIVEEISVFTVDTIPITMRYSAHYFIRPEEVGQLFTMFHHDYDPVFRRIVTSSIRTQAGSTFTVDNFRFNRTLVEREFHVMLRKRLGGDCCPTCCPSSCQSNLICSKCKQTNCTLGYHVDMRYFFLLDVKIPEEVFERYLRFAILEIEKEKEFFLQDHALTTKETEMLTRQIQNEANEITSTADAKKEKIEILAEADREKHVQKSYAEALKNMYSSLNVTREDYKLSLMMVRTLEDQAENLYEGFGFEKNTLSAP